MVTAVENHNLIEFGLYFISDFELCTNNIPTNTLLAKKLNAKKHFRIGTKSDPLTLLLFP